MLIVTQDPAFLEEQMTFLSLKPEELTAHHPVPGVGQLSKAQPFQVSVFSSLRRRSLLSSYSLHGMAWLLEVLATLIPTRVLGLLQSIEID